MIGTISILLSLFLSFSVIEGNKHHHANGGTEGGATENSPLFPARLPPVPFQSPTYRHNIPRKIWIAIKDRNDPLPPHLKEFIDRNAQWEVVLCDNQCKDEFMEKLFAGTSILWAYSMINPLVYAAKADIWRYSVLYTFGGMYLDDDSDIKVPLDDVSYYLSD